MSEKDSLVLKKINETSSFRLPLKEENNRLISNRNYTEQDKDESDPRYELLDRTYNLLVNRYAREKKEAMASLSVLDKNIDQIEKEIES